MHTGLHPCSDHPAANLQLLRGSTAVLVFKTQNHGLRDGTKQGQSLHAGLLLSLAVTAMTAVRGLQPTGLLLPIHSHPNFLTHCQQCAHTAAFIIKMVLLDNCPCLKRREQEQQTPALPLSLTHLAATPRVLPLSSSPLISGGGGSGSEGLMWKSKAAFLPGAHQR